MKKIQLTLIQIDNYGPWTVTPVHRREADLQTLQAELFADLERLFSARGGLVFCTRFDNMIAISNGIDVDAHRAIQESIHNRYPITLSMSIGAAETPYEAQVLATQALQRVGSSRSVERRGALTGECVIPPDEDWVQIAHLDVDHTSSMTDSRPIYDTHMLLQKVHLLLMEALRDYEALVFYTGGDNFMVPSNGVGARELQAIIEDVQRKLKVELKAGVGSGATAELAARLANQGLKEIREGRTTERVVFKTG
jgi:GTP cyclohydrolase IIa